MKTFEEVYETLPGNGWLLKEEAKLLWDFAGQFEGPILEVGCYEGRSTVLLANLGRPLVCVDPFDGFTDDRTGDAIHKVFYKNLLSRGFRTVMLYRMKIEDWQRDRSVNFVYLDGDHTPEGTRVQINVAKAVGAKGIAIHDVNDSGDGKAIRDVALAMLGPWESRVQRLATWGIKT